MPRSASACRPRCVAALRSMSHASDRLRVFRRVASQHVECQRGVAHAPRDRPHHVAIAGERHHARVGHQREAGLDPDQRLRRGGVLDRPAGLLRQAKHRHAGGDGGRGAGAAATRQELAPGGVVGRPRPAIVGVAAGMAQHGNVGLAQDDRTRRAHPRHNRGVGAGHQIDAAGLAVQQRPAGGGWKTHHVHRVLDHDGHTRERPERFTGGAATVDRPCVGQGVRIEEDDGVVVRVVGGDAVEKRLGQRLGGDGIAGKGGLHVRQRHLHDVDRHGRLRRCCIAHDRRSSARCF